MFLNKKSQRKAWKLGAIKLKKILFDRALLSFPMNPKFFESMSSVIKQRQAIRTCRLWTDENGNRRITVV
jgi:hypothetical protein